MGKRTVETAEARSPGQEAAGQDDARQKAAGQDDAGGPHGGPGCEVHHRLIHGHRRAYRVAGDPSLEAGGPAGDDDRPTLLLLHGIGDNSASWVPLMDGLARDHRVIAPDLLGHGQSDKPRADYSAAAFANGMRDLLEVLGIDRVTVVGHSLGGGVAAQFSYQYADRVERLVLVSAGGVAREVSPLLRLAAAPLSELFVPVVHTPGGRLVVRLGTRLLGATGGSRAFDAEQIQRVFEALPEDGAYDAFTRTLRAVVDWRGQVVTMRDRVYLAEMIPMLIVWGTDDQVIPVEHGHLLHSSAPHARFSLYDGCGHFPHLQDPNRFLDELSDFVATTDPAEFDPELFQRYLRRGTTLEEDTEVLDLTSVA